MNSYSFVSVRNEIERTRQELLAKEKDVFFQKRNLLLRLKQEGSKIILGIVKESKENLEGVLQTRLGVKQIKGTIVEVFEDSFVIKFESGLRNIFIEDLLTVESISKKVSRNI